jgi:hypothetical protein
MSCYYTLETTKLENVDSINIEGIENKTNEYRINEYLMNELTRIFVNDSNLKLGKSGENTADLNITIKEFNEEVVAIDFNENPTSKKIIIRLKYLFKREEEVIDENKDYVFEYNYVVEANKNDDVYIQEAMKNLAKNLKDQLVEGF